MCESSSFTAFLKVHPFRGTQDSRNVIKSLFSSKSPFNRDKAV